VRLGAWIVVAFTAVALLTWLVLSRPRPNIAERDCPGSPIDTAFAPRAAPTGLRGAVVALNPGHGLTRFDDGTWRFQRPEAGEDGAYILEDDANLLMTRSVARVLEDAGATVFSTRNLAGEPDGTSGEPAWRESARDSLRRRGVSQTVWNSRGRSLRGDCAAGRDLRARALYANAVRADVLVSVHSNAGVPWNRGTQVFYGTRSYLGGAPSSPRAACLAHLLADAVPAAIRARRPDLNWGAGEVKGSNNYGENGYALMPAVILEVGFHTNAVDGKALGEASFRAAVAEGVRDALEAFFKANTCP
jgi:N-acetylmuramoyl-L-alanine amidase